jgi:hypothetical protein
MMDHLTASDIDRLVSHQDGPCVSIYMPTEHRGPETRQNPLRFRHAIDEALAKLTERGLRHSEAEAVVAPIARLADDHDFWQHQEDGLAIMLAPDISDTFRLPQSFDPLVVVADRFHIKPLLPLLGAGTEFYVLTLSHNHIRLLRGSRFRVSELELENVPTSVAEALWYRDPETELQYHGTSAGGTTLAFHGHGLGNESTNEELVAFFRHVDKGVSAIVNSGRAPVVLAGVAYLHPLYRHVTSLDVVEQGIEGNADKLSADILHDRAWPLVVPAFEQQQLRARERFAADWNAGNATASGSVPEVIMAALQGRVATLFTPLGRQLWGSVDPATFEVSMDGDESATDLYDVAAAATWRNGGDVYVVDPADIPGGSELAATLRY